jgi:hypothetical protein
MQRAGLKTIVLRPASLFHVIETLDQSLRSLLTALRSGLLLLSQLFFMNLGLFFLGELQFIHSGRSTDTRRLLASHRNQSNKSDTQEKQADTFHENLQIRSFESGNKVRYLCLLPV